MKNQNRIRHSFAAVVLSLSVPVALCAEPARPAPVARPAAAEAGKRGDMHKQLKEQALQYLDAKIRILQTTKTCVNAANTNAALLVCYEQERKQTKALRKADREKLEAAGVTSR